MTMLISNPSRVQKILKIKVRQIILCKEWEKQKAWKGIGSLLLLHAWNPHAFPKIKMEFHPYFWWSFPPAQKQKQWLSKPYHADICQGFFYCNHASPVKSLVQQDLPVSWYKSGIKQSLQSNYMLNMVTCIQASKRYHFARWSLRKSENLPVKQILQVHHVEKEKHAEQGLVSGDADISVSHFAKSKPGHCFQKHKRSKAKNRIVTYQFCFKRSMQRFINIKLRFSSFETYESYKVS